MSKIDRNKTRNDSGSSSNLHRRLQRAGNRISDQPVQISKLDPEWNIDRDCNTSRPTFLIRSTTLGWSSALLAVIAICLLTWQLSGTKPLNLGKGTSVDSSSIAVDTNVSPIDEAPNTKADVAQIVASALAKKHSISFAPTVFRENNQPAGHATKTTWTTSVSLHSIFRKRQFSLGALPGEIAEFDEFSIPKVRFHLSPTGH